MPRASAGIELGALRPMLLVERKAVPRGAGWLAEIKFDGYRALASTGSTPSVRTKNGADCTTWFPELQPALASLPAGCIVDGEICVLDTLGRADFNRVHERARRRRWYDGADLVVYCVFDLLCLQGQDVRQLPIEDRKGALKQLLAGGRAKGKVPGLLYVQAALDQCEWLYGQALALDLEGIVCKRIGSTYQDGTRSADWVKVKRPGAVPPERFKR